MYKVLHYINDNLEWQSGAYLVIWHSSYTDKTRTLTVLWQPTTFVSLNTMSAQVYPSLLIKKIQLNFLQFRPIILCVLTEKEVV